jgi:hypothetical protein
MKNVLLAGATVLALGASAMAAQTVPAELSGTPQTTRFLIFPLAAANKCVVGAFMKGGKFGSFCDVSISECLSVHGSIAKDFRGDWACTPAGH